MTPKNKENLFTFLLILGIILIVLAGTLALIYYYKFVNLECPIPCEIVWGNFSS